MIDRLGNIVELNVAKNQKHIAVLSNGKEVRKTNNLYKLPFEAVNELNKRKSRNGTTK